MLDADDLLPLAPGVSPSGADARKGPAPMGRGAVGRQVRLLQRRLVALGYLAPEALLSGAGVFGPKTEAAVRAFQAKARLNVTGRVGRQTWAALMRQAVHQRELRQTAHLPPPFEREITASGEMKAPDASGYVPRFTGRVPAKQVYNVDAGRPLDPPVTSTAALRSRGRYSDVIDQLGVATNPRYQQAAVPGDVLFVWDVMGAMGAAFPFSPKETVESISAWLERKGALHGWRRAQAKVAQAFANAGRPALAICPTAGEPGHVAVVRPGTLGAGGPALAQAGARCFTRGTVAHGFGARLPDYWIHD
jgi:peptidoglycan hydrolase-like protein with peptidoglycan-binding domain